MGSGVSRFAGSGTLKRLVNAANLPLDVDDDISHDQLQDPGKVSPRSRDQFGMHATAPVFSLLTTAWCSSASSAERLHPSIRC